MFGTKRAKCKNMTISLPKPTIDKLKLMANKDNVPYSRFIDTLIKDRYKQRKRLKLY